MQHSMRLKKCLRNVKSNRKSFEEQIPAILPLAIIVSSIQALELNNVYNKCIHTKF